MAYVVNVTESLEGIFISPFTKTNNKFIVSDIFAKSTASAFGISMGDMIQDINDEPFGDIVSQLPFTDPNRILWDIETPFTLTCTSSKPKGRARRRRKPTPFIQSTTKSDDAAPAVPADSNNKWMVTEPVADCDSEQMTREMYITVTPPIKESSTESSSVSVDEIDLESNNSMDDAANKSSQSFNSLPQFPPKSSNPPSRRTIRFKVNDNNALSRPKGRGRRKATPFTQSTTAPTIAEILRKSSEDSEVSPSPSPIPTPLGTDTSDELLRRHILQRKSLNPFVHFDIASITESNGKVIAVSSKPLVTGKHKWTIELTQVDVEVQEIGVCTVCDIDGIDIHDLGATETKALGARGVYGSELRADSVWYTTMNENGQRRCFKDLTECHPIGWTTKDRIKVVVNLDKSLLTFYRNGRKVRDVVMFDSMYTRSSCSKISIIEPRDLANYHL